MHAVQSHAYNLIMQKFMSVYVNFFLSLQMILNAVSWELCFVDSVSAQIRMYTCNNFTNCLLGGVCCYTFVY